MIGKIVWINAKLNLTKIDCRKLDLVEIMYNKEKKIFCETQTIWFNYGYVKSYSITWSTDIVKIFHQNTIITDWFDTHYEKEVIQLPVVKFVPEATAVMRTVS